MERGDLASVAGFFSGDEPLARRGVIVLGDEAVHHARVRRLAVGDRVYVVDGVGGQGVGSIARLTKSSIEIAIDDVRRAPRTPQVHMLVPIADRDRMLWCAEKCTELGATSWRPVMWNRSRSVSPRGEGASFRPRLMARMKSALVQAHGSWLPESHDDVTLDEAIAKLPIGGTRLALDASGDEIQSVAIVAPVTIAVGPEGGIEAAELQLLCDASFRAVSLGANVLRFETAAVAALAIARSTLGASSEMTNG